ncbi:MAG: peptidoglycan-binding protein [Hyphomicrobiaceae bacterium]|nr:peptidoglycan-binding protein [Hyphomicrobiaceae bacterium]
MRTRAVGYASASGTMLFALAMTATAASAAPDLVIQAADSKVEFKSCEDGQPLAEGRIVIRNEGDSEANLRSADDFFRSFVAVYVPENIDLIDKDTKRTKIEPGEQRAITFTIGKDAKKKSRNYHAFASGGAAGGFPTEKDWLKNTAKYKDQIISVQKLLVSRGYFLGNSGPEKDGADGNWGRASSTALKNFQNVQKLKATGEWNEETAKAIAALTGGTKPKVENIKNDKGETQITLFAVVDPYNLIDESNERNNILAYTGFLKCD